ncbi:3-hydroxybutyryl-CoA dehydrogenase [Pontibacter aydingkolensis]|uniref:3-hydroxybutyryl-CoA dehydrogenase n=1 Tax=Pontibacter aydingkolensis TaxID=1911536 RepID=A0ABS7CQ82_9BACT|nr:3-hydroxyacyl-CoA dehydrogenase NAD-binding domain-containing protein [Pontibacter aydingkolensis]MBW7465989.1 3-hydroxybutyryl-CoA dehydrogenase [Pontibacter aydingkolensis]
MKLEDIKTIGVVGAGTMGQGIAQICAQAGYKTILFDINAQVLEKAETTTKNNLDKGIERGKLTEQEKQTALANLTFTGNTLQLSCDVIIEAIVERLEVKQSIFKELADINTPDTILASNTSSIPITQIAAAVPNPERVVGMHFFNPAHIMKLVEVISGAATAPEIAETIKQLAEKLGKTAVMAKDSPGFIVNRVARHFYVEGLKLLEEGVADIETIDKLMQASGFKMGPFELMDLIGVDTNYSVTTSMFEAFHYDPKFRPSRIQQQKVDAGHHGRKSGKGFYKYD